MAKRTNSSLDDVIIPAHPCPPARCSAEEWEAEAATLEHVRGDWIPFAVEAADARCEFTCEQGKGRYAGHDAVHALAKRGARFAEIARIVNTTVPNVVRLFCQYDEDVAEMQLAEEILRVEGCPSQAEVARRSGLSRSAVQRLCIALGIESEQTKSMKAGGGRTIPATTYDEIKRLREAGFSASKIGERTGVKPATVTRICTRRGWVKGVLA